jgi:hypothetical protein
VVNRGLLKVWDEGRDYSFGGAAVVSVPVENTAAGRIWVAENSVLAIYGKDLQNAGVVEVGPGATLRLHEYSGPARLVTEAGSQLVGAGTLVFNSSTVFEVAGATELECRLVVQANGMTVGSGVLTLKNNQELTGFFGCPLVAAEGSSMVIQSAWFTNQVIISSNAVMSIAGNSSLRADGVITNHGTILLASGYPTPRDRLTGNGCLAVGGRCEIYRGDTNTGAALVRIPIAVLPPAQLVVRSNAYLWMGGSSCLLNAGTVEVQSGAVFNMTDTAPFDLVLFANSEFAGGGQTTLGGTNRLLVLGSSALAGGTLNLTGTSTMAGQGRFAVDAGATFWMDHSVTFPGTVDLDGTMTLSQPGITNQINAALTLGATGTLNNPGTVRAGFYFDLGGTINGNTPVIIGEGGGPVLGLDGN